ncbi:DUF982 domain-containing protein [Rhizobium leguminosarum]|uniref:DUF982 domain-containing protein n=1 Tax=Rhizobium leguminosarum TaxID=384 RepID=UPI003517F58A
MAKKKPGSIAVISFHMLNLQLHGVGGYRNITTVNDAAEWLLHRWPVAGGRQHLQCGLDRVRRAATACKAVGVDDPALAEFRWRRAFERDARRTHEAGRPERLERLRGLRFRAEQVSHECIHSAPHQRPAPLLSSARPPCARA